MRTVFFIRHAKSSWKDLYLDDIDRPLNKRGNRDAPLMSQKLVELIQEDPSIHLDQSIILSSNALRTQETVEHFNQTLQLKRQQIIFDSNLYLADEDYLVESLFQLQDQYSCAFLFAHNPGMTFLANQCRRTPVDNIPTCGIFRVDFDVLTWNEVSTQVSYSTWFIYPKMFDS